MGVEGELELQVCVQRVVDRVTSRDPAAGKVAQERMVNWFVAKDAARKAAEEAERNKVPLGSIRRYADHWQCNLDGFRELVCELTNCWLVLFFVIK